MLSEAHFVDTYPEPAAEASTNIRWRIMGLCLLVSIVTYLDRVNISIAAKYVITENHLSAVKMGEIFSAFTLSYALFQVSGGWMADRFGSRIVLTAAIVWWSIFTALTAGITSVSFHTLLPAFASLLLARFCLGAGEAAAWPSFNRTIARWIPLKDRAFASSIPLAGGGLGAAVAPPFVAWLMVRYGWRDAFYVCAVIGLLCGIVWFLEVRDTPEEHPSVNAAELQEINFGIEPKQAMRIPSGVNKTPWKAVLTEPNVWLLGLSSMCCGYLIYIYFSWFYLYLTEVRHISLIQGSFYTTGPFIAIAIMSPLGGTLGDRVVRRFGLVAGRRSVAMGGMLVAAVALFVGANMTGIMGAVLCLSLGAGAIFFALGAHWATSIDISKQYAGTVSGVMNLVGNMGGVISPIMTPIIARRWGWLAALEVAAAVVVMGACLWPFIHPNRLVLSNRHLTQNEAL